MGPNRDGTLRLAQWQPNAKMRATTRALDDLDSAAVRIDEFRYHG